MGGQGSWDKGARERGPGLPRVTPDAYLRPTDPNMNWPDYRASLVKEVKDPPFAIDARVCAYGDSTEVPG